MKMDINILNNNKKIYFYKLNSGTHKKDCPYNLGSILPGMQTWYIMNKSINAI